MILQLSIAYIAPDVAAAVSHRGQRLAVAAEVSLHRVRDARFVGVGRGLMANVRTGDDPRRQVALRQRASHSPVAARSRRFDGDIRKTTWSRPAQGEQILWPIERRRGQQIQLTVHGQVGKQRRCVSSGVANGTAERRKGIAKRRIVGVEIGDARFCFLQDAALQMAQSPRDLIVFVPLFGFRCGWRFGDNADTRCKNSGVS